MICGHESGKKIIELIRDLRESESITLDNYIEWDILIHSVTFELTNIRKDVLLRKFEHNESKWKNYHKYAS